MGFEDNTDIKCSHLGTFTEYKFLKLTFSILFTKLCHKGFVSLTNFLKKFTHYNSQDVCVCLQKKDSDFESIYAVVLKISADDRYEDIEGMLSDQNIMWFNSFKR